MEDGTRYVRALNDSFARCGLSPDQFAARTDHGADTVCRYLSGDRVADKDFLDTLARVRAACGDPVGNGELRCLNGLRIGAQGVDGDAARPTDGGGGLRLIWLPDLVAPARRNETPPPAAVERGFGEVCQALRRALSIRARGRGLLEVRNWPRDRRWWIVRANLVELDRVHTALRAGAPPDEVADPFHHLCQVVLAQVRLLSEEAQPTPDIDAGGLFCVWARSFQWKVKGRGGSYTAKGWNRLLMSFDMGHAHAGLILGNICYGDNEMADALEWYEAAYQAGNVEAAVTIVGRGESLMPEQGEHRSVSAFRSLWAERATNLLRAQNEANQPHFPCSELRGSTTRGALHIARECRSDEDRLSWYARAYQAGQDEAAEELGRLSRERAQPERADHWWKAHERRGRFPVERDEEMSSRRERRIRAIEVIGRFGVYGVLLVSIVSYMVQFFSP